MILSDKLVDELISLEKETSFIIQNSKSISNIQLEGYLRSLEKRRYHIIKLIKLYNETVEYSTEKIKMISDEYRAEAKNNILKIYVPEPMPKYKNLRTHAYKNILLNILEITKPYKNMFSNKVCVYIKIFDNIKGWDIDNKSIKPISDALISSGVIKDDSIDKMFYSVKGEFSEVPHTEIYVFDGEFAQKIFEKTISN